MSFAHVEFCERKDMKRGSKPFEISHADGAGLQKLLTSREHAQLLERVKAHGAADRFHVYMAKETGSDVQLRLCKGAELRSKLMRVVLPIARHDALEPQMLINTDYDCFSPLFDNDHRIVVDYCITFFLTPLYEVPDFMPNLKSIPEPMGTEGNCLLCVIEPNNFEREHMGAAQAAIAKLAQKIPIKRVCSACKMIVDGRLKCSLCRQALYCGQECQKAHWKEHKATCAGCK